MVNVDQPLENIVKEQLNAKRAARRKDRDAKRNRAVRSARRRQAAPVSKGRNVFSDRDIAENGAQKMNLFVRGRRSPARRSRSRSPRRRNEPMKMLVSNLESGVSQKDMEELFGEFQDFKKAQMHYDRNGKSLGNCELMFRSREGALRAAKQYKGVPLDGLPMEINILGDNVPLEPVSKRLGPAPRRAMSPPRATRRRGSRGAAAGGGGGPRGGRRGSAPASRPARRAEEKKSVPTAEQLDKELDTYLSAGTAK